MCHRNEGYSSTPKTSTGLPDYLGYQKNYAARTSTAPTKAHALFASIELPYTDLQSVTNTWGIYLPCDLDSTGADY